MKTDKAIWRGHGWKMPTKGRAKIKRGVRPYGGTVQDFVRQDGDIVVLFIEPSERQYRADEIEWIKGN